MMNGELFTDVTQSDSILRNPIFFQKSDFLNIVSPLRNPIFFQKSDFLNILET